MTYLSNLIISIFANDNAKPSEILLAAQRGRKGEVDCLETYSKCKLKLWCNKTFCHTDDIQGASFQNGLQCHQLSE